MSQKQELLSLATPANIVDVWEFDSYYPEPIGPEPKPLGFFGNIAKPFADFGTSLYTGYTKAAETSYEQLPQRLFDWSMGKLGGSVKRTEPQGGGTSITYNQQKYAGGAPADPNYIVLPAGQQPGVGGIVQMPAAAGLSTFALIGIGLIIFLAMRK